VSATRINELLKNSAGTVLAGGSQGVVQCEGAGNPPQCEPVQDGKATINRTAQYDITG
jgi:hypothetical protein